MIIFFDRIIDGFLEYATMLLGILVVVFLLDVLLYLVDRRKRES